MHTIYIFLKFICGVGKKTKKIFPNQKATYFFHANDLATPAKGRLYT